MQTTVLKNKIARLQQKTESGVALLFVILLTSVLLMVSMGITNIAYKEALLSIQAHDSDRAFFAADTGIECALYLDTAAVFAGSPMDTGTFQCRGMTLPIINSGSVYTIAMPLASELSCALITVDKNYTGTKTRIESVGYNVTAATPTACVVGAPGLRVVTRALRLEYTNP